MTIAQIPPPESSMDNNIARLIERLEEAYLASLGSHQDRAFLSEAATTLRLQDERLEAMREVLNDLEKCATATLTAMDEHNEKHGTHLIGPALLKLGKGIARARTALSDNSQKEGV